MGKFLFISGCGLLAAILFALQWQNAGNMERDFPAHPGKIVSLAPGITETLYTLGLGDQVAGVTEFCAWPAEAATKPKIGGFREINLEAIARTGADLVVMPANMAHFRKLVEDIGMPVQLFDMQSLHNFLRDVGILGRITGRGEKARELVARFEDARKKASHRPKTPTVLMVLMSPDECKRSLTDLTVIGSDGFYDELIRIAGGKNAYAGATAFPRMSLESIIALDPDIIAVAAPDIENVAELKSRWNSITHLKAVRNGHLLILDDPGDTVPGPRSLATLEKLDGEISRIAAETPRSPS